MQSEGAIVVGQRGEVGQMILGPISVQRLWKLETPKTTPGATSTSHQQNFVTDIICPEW